MVDFTFNKDGSVDLPVEGKPLRFVKESDLLAVKGGIESKQKEWDTKEATYNTQLAEANRLREESHQNLLKTQAEKEQIASKYNDYDTLKGKVGELEKNNATLTESSGKYEKELADRIKKELISLHGAKEDALKDKDLTQLRNIESAASIFGTNGHKKANYDGGAGSGGGASESPLDRAKRIIEEHETKHGRVKVVSPK